MTNTQNGIFFIGDLIRLPNGDYRTIVDFDNTHSVDLQLILNDGTRLTWQVDIVGCLHFNGA